MKKYCEYCHKPIGEPNKIYIAGSICRGHILTPWEYIVFKVKKIIN